MTEQPIESPTEQDWLGNPIKPPVENYLHKGHLIPVTSLRSPEALALMRARIHTQVLLNIAEKESTRAEEALQLALAVEDTARGEVLKATEAIDEFARKTASA